MSLLRFFKTVGLMESGPDALLGFRLQSSFVNCLIAIRYSLVDF